MNIGPPIDPQSQQDSQKSFGAKAGFILIFVGLLSLIVGMFWGIIGGIQYLSPEFLKDSIPFNRIRPLHVTFVVSWILMTASGGIYYYMATDSPGFSWAKGLTKFQLSAFLVAGLCIPVFLFFGIMGGREYMAWYPLLSLPIWLGWLAFGGNFFRKGLRNIGKWPVYRWMWGTGIFFFILTFTEAHLWMIPWFRENILRDMTVQWKSYGSLVGSWNMMVYGTGVYLVTKLSGDDKTAYSKTAYALYFLGLTNLMFGWGHHTYIIPAAPWIRLVAYAISMTEWLLLARMIRNWLKSRPKGGIESPDPVVSLLKAADFWVFFNLGLALLISIPAINLFTHGTHITVAHAMGTTIGINTPFLLASVFYIYNKEFPTLSTAYTPNFSAGFYLFQACLVLFCLALILAGVEKGMHLYDQEPANFQVVQQAILPYWKLVFVSGLGLFAGVLLMVEPILKAFWRRLRV